MATEKITPKVFIISMFQAEADTWLVNRDYPKFERRIPMPGFNPLYPDVHCTASGDICQLTTGESLANAALALSAVTLSPQFDLTKTYFLIAGIAGVNPGVGTLGSVLFARFAVQIDLQYEFDAREIPRDWAAGYVPLGSSAPDQYPAIVYGHEVFEINRDLRDVAIGFAKKATLDDSAAAAAYRAKFSADDFPAARAKPEVAAHDTIAGNVFFHGHLLADSMQRYFRLMTGESGATYGTTEQEDTATLASLLRANLQGRADFSRIIIMRAGSNFDRPYAPDVRPEVPLHTNHGGFEPSVENLYRCGVEVVRGILEGWESRFEQGVQPSNYVGDILGSLGSKPPWGPPGKALPPPSAGP